MSNKALAQPEQEPVGTFAEVADTMNTLRVGTVAQQQMYAEMKDKPLYTSPPTRKPLTDEEIDEIYFKSSLEVDSGREDVYDFARAIEAAHDIKENT